MPSTGSPWNIWFPDDTSPVAPLENLFLSLATSVATALSGIYNRNLRRESTQSDLNLVTGMQQYDIARVDAIPGAYFEYDGTAWVMVGIAGPFADATARDAAITSPAEGMRARLSGDQSLSVYLGSAWCRQDVIVARGRQTTSTIGNTSGTVDADAGVSLPSLGFATVVDLEFFGILDVIASPPSVRNAYAQFASSAGTMTHDTGTASADAVSFPGSVSTDDSRTIVARAQLALPASTAATVKLQGVFSNNGINLRAGAWRYVRRSGQ